MSLYKYEDVVITITVSFKYGTTYYSLPLEVELNIGGTGSKSASQKLDTYWQNDWIVKYASYEVTSVKGTVTPII